LFNKSVCNRPSDEEESSSEEEVKEEQAPAPKKTKQRHTPNTSRYMAQLLAEKTGVPDDVMEKVLTLQTHTHAHTRTHIHTHTHTHTRRWLRRLVALPSRWAAPKTR
jgi:hypothetical protein